MQSFKVFVMWSTEIDECATQPPRCLNGGSCIDLVADWRCACADDRWRGRRCEIGMFVYNIIMSLTKCTQWRGKQKVFRG